MIERELVAIIRSLRADSIGGDDGVLSAERAEAMDRYHGRPYGNEDEGRSAVVSRDLSETVDWAMPAIMRVFTQSGNLGEFDPVGPEDEEQAQQESDAVNHVVMKMNEGFILIHDVVKDALLLKNGYAKHWCEYSDKVTEEEYSGLTMQEIAAMMANLEGEGAEVKVKGQESRQIALETPQGPMPIEVFDIRLQITRHNKKICVEAVPAEEVRVSRRCRGSLQGSPFVEHVTRKTRTALIEMGMKKAFVNDLPAASEARNTNQERVARDSVDEEADDLGAAFIDRTMDEIEYCEAYLRVDWDGDGVAELRKVVTVADRIPPGDDWNEQIESVPITGGVPKRVPHRHVGESLWDELADLAEIKTALFRQALDNVYATNNSQWLVNERVNLADFLTSLPGGVKRVKGIDPIGDSAQPVQTAPVLNQILPAIDYIDRIKQTRTGISESTTGLDPDILKQSTKGAFLENLNRASQKIEMITRMLAETFVKPMLLEVHGLMIRHQDKPMRMRLRGKYVSVNPQEWRERTDLTIRVGLGTGNAEEKKEKLLLIAQAQQQLGALGLVGPRQAYNLFTDLSKALGFDMPEKYAINPDPNNPEYQQVMQQQAGGKKDPLVEAEEVKAKATLQKAQMDQQGRGQELQAKSMLERERMGAEMAFKEREAQIQAELEWRKAQLRAETEIKTAQIKAQVDAQAAQMEDAMEMRRALIDSEIQLKGILEQAKAARESGNMAAITGGLEAMIVASNRPKKIKRDTNGRVEGIE